MNIQIHLKKTVDKSYSVTIQEGLLNNFSFLKNKLEHYSKICIISDTNVYTLYGDSLKNSIEKSGQNVYSFVITPGEKSKSREQKAKIEDFLLDNKFNRNSLLLALGGGVVGDLTGYTASTFLRGIDFIQIPTSLLAMVDSSIGGKTAISTTRAKNIIGTFHQPKAVFIDPAVLETLPETELKAGLVESIKKGVVFDESYFSFLEKNISKILNLDSQTIAKVIEGSIKIKSDVVIKDENEDGLRQILNYGHTIGHAIETLSDYEILHGECVAIGMKYAGLISNKLGFLSSDDLKRQNTILNKLGYFLNIPNINKEKIIETLYLDKKNTDNNINFVLIKSIGSVYSKNDNYSIPIQVNLILEVLNNQS